MEHSYSRDCRPIDGANGLKTHTLMIHRPPQCPACHIHASDENNELDETNRPLTPSYNEKNAVELMNECLNVAKCSGNTFSDDVDWENCVNMTGWTPDQIEFFHKVTKILDTDHLARLATTGIQNEPIQKRLIIDKSVKRIRKEFGRIKWDLRLTQWLHETLANNLPPTYMAIYIDILQTLKTKLPQLVDKILFGRPINMNQDLLAPVLKKKWEIILEKKERKLPGNVAFVIIPSVQLPYDEKAQNRMNNWYNLLCTMGKIVLVLPPNGTSINKQPLQQVIEAIIQNAKTKIQDLRSEQSNINIVLLGFNAGASLVLQLAYTENINCVICLGFACNTINGIRGAPDDRILDITTPVMFVVGQNSARTSQEEIEALREKMKSETNLLIVGSADDVLRISKTKKQNENLTQSMVDSMVADEIHEFVNTCICKPPGPRIPTSLIGNFGLQIGNSTHQNKNKQNKSATNSLLNAGSNPGRKRKYSDDRNSDEQGTASVTKKQYNKTGQVGRPRTRVPTTPGKTRRQSPDIISAEKLNKSLHTAMQLPRSEEIKPKSIDNANSNIYEHTVSGSSNQNLTKVSLTTAPQVTTISTLGTSTILHRTNPSQTQSNKLKLVPSSQFVQLKPPIQSQSKIYTIKTTSMPSSTLSHSTGTNIIPVSGSRTSGQVQILPLKNQTSQFLTNNTSNQIILNPQKYTISKSNNAAIQEKNDISNIFDMPILFADNDGNIHDSTTKLSIAKPLGTTPNPTKILSLPSNLVIKPRIANIQQSNVSKDVTNTINSSQLSSGTFVLSPTAINKSKIGGSGKVVYINRNTMKPFPSIISKPALSSMKYTKVVVTNPQTSTSSFVSRATGISDTPNVPKTGILQGTTVSLSKPQQQQIAGNSASISNNSVSSIVKQMNQPTSGILNCTTIASTSSTTTNKQYQVLLNLGESNSTKTTASPVKNIIKMEGASPMNQTILLKTGNTVKQMPLIKTSNTLNKNLSIKKVVNFIPSGGINVSGNSSGSTEHKNSNSDDNVISTITLPRTGLVVQPLSPTSVTNFILSKNQKKYTYNVNDVNSSNSK